MVRWAVIVLLVTVGAAAFAASARPGEETSSEFVVGDYLCSANSAYAFMWLSLQATGGILTGNQYLYEDHPVQGSAGETCAPLASAMQGLLSSHACAVGTIDVRTDESGESHGFRFVCDGTRSGVVSAMAAAARALVVSEAP